VESAAEVIARAVRARRIELRLSTEDAAGRARIPEKAWRVIEQGTTKPSGLMIEALCRALEWTPATIDSLVEREVTVNGKGEIVVDLHEPPPAPAAEPQRRAGRVVTGLDTEGLTADELADVQDFIDEIRDSR
jgi:transcriptional regulator with XRE-family HTH domain